MGRTTNPIYDYIHSCPVRLKRLLKLHMQAFPDNIRPYLRLCLEDYSDRDRELLEHDIQKAIQIIPDAKEQLEYAWKYGCLYINQLSAFDQILKKIVQIIKTTKKDYEISEKIMLISLIAVDLPMFRYEEAIAYALYKDKDYTFLGMGAIDLLKQEKEFFVYPFIRSVGSILEKNFSPEDLEHINHMLSILQTTYQRGKTAGIELLEYWIPNIIMYNEEKERFIDPSIEYQDHPANNWEIGESVQQKVLTFGDIPFSEKGFPDQDLIPAIRSCIHSIEETARQPEILPSRFALAAKKELNAPISHVTFVEAGKYVGVSVMECADKLYVLYKDQDVPHGLFGMSLENNPSEDQSIIFYPIDPKEVYKIKPVKI